MGKISMNFIILISILLIENGKSLRSNEFCLKNEFKSSCQGEYGFVCEMNKCSLSEAACEQFKNKWVTKYLNFRIIRIPIKNDRSFLNEIKKCSENQIANSICINSKTCFKKNITRIALNDDMFGLSKDCPCSNIRPYNCMKHYCAVNKETCKIFVNRLDKEKRSLSQLSKCKNAVKLNYF